MFAAINTIAFRALVGATLGLAVAAMAPAWAEEGELETQVRTVSTAGLDLAVPADQAKLHHRLAVAAMRVCSSGMREPLGDSGYQSCFIEARAKAFAEADRRIVAATGTSQVASAQPR